MSSRRKSSAPFSLFAFQDIITSVTGIMLLITMMLALELIKRKEQSPPGQTKIATSNVHDAIAANQNEIERLKALLSATDDHLRYDATTLARKLAELKDVNSTLNHKLEDLERRSEAVRQQQEVAEQNLTATVTPREIQEMQRQLENQRQQIAELKQSNRVLFSRSERDSKKPWIIEVDGQGVKVAEVGVSAPPEIFVSPSSLREWANDKSRDNIFFVMLVKPTGLQNFETIKADLEDLGFELGLDLLSSNQKVIDSEVGAGLHETQN